MKIALPDSADELAEFTTGLKKALEATVAGHKAVPLTGWRWRQQRAYHLFSRKTPGEVRVTDFETAIKKINIDLRTIIHECTTILTSTSTEFAALIITVLKAQFNIPDTEFIADFKQRSSFPSSLSTITDDKARYAAFAAALEHRDAFIEAEKKAMTHIIRTDILPAIEAVFAKLRPVSPT